MKKSTKTVLITAAALIVLGIIISSISLKDGANIEVRREDGSTNSVGEMINEAVDKAGSYIMEQIDDANITGSGDYIGVRSWNEVSADNAYSVPAEGVSSLSIAWIAGAVEIVPVSGDEIKISETCENSLDDETALCWRVENGTLEIKYSARRDELPVKYLRIELPETVEFEDVAVDMTTSGVSAEGLTVKKLTVGSVSGNLIFRNCTVGTVVAETVSGEVQIDMRNADAKLKINTVSGNVSLLVPEGTQPSVRFSSVSGDMVHSIDCTVSENAAFSVDTVSGDLQIAAEKYE